jgi:PKD repeat protein
MITETEEILINEKTINDIDAHIGTEKIQFQYSPDSVLGDVTIKVIIDPDDKIKETDETNNVVNKILHINYAPVALDLKIKNSTINRTGQFILYGNGSDSENTTSELKPVLEFKHEDRSLWSQFSGAQLLTFYNTQNARWQFEITTNITMDTGKYSFRIHFIDSNLAMSNYVFLHDALLLNNQPTVIDLAIDKTQIYRNDSIKLSCKTSDIETITEYLIVKMQYKHIPTEGPDKGWVDLENIEYNALNDTWESSLKFVGKAKTGSYQFRAWAIDEEQDESDKFELSMQLTVLNNQPMIVEFEASNYSVLRMQEIELVAKGFDLEDKNRLDSLVCWINYTHYTDSGEPPKNYLPLDNAIWENDFLSVVEYDFDLNGWKTAFKPPKDAPLGYYFFSIRIQDMDDNWSEPLFLKEPIEVLNNQPEADIGNIPLTIYEDDIVTLDASKSKDEEDEVDDLEFKWELSDDDGPFRIAFNNSFSFIIHLAGEYTLRLTVTDKDGFFDWKVSTISIVNVNPTAEATMTTTRKYVNTPFLVSAESSTDSGSDMISLNYTWDLGDGTTAYGMKVNHSYSEAKTYTLSLTVTDDDGDSDTIVTTIRVYPLDEPKEPVTDDGEESSMALFAGVAVIIIIIVIIILFLLLLKRKQIEEPTEPIPPPSTQEPIPEQYMPMQQGPLLPPEEQLQTTPQTMDVQPDYGPQPTLDELPMEEKTTTGEITTTPQEPILPEPEQQPLLPEASSIPENEPTEAPEEESPVTDPTELNQESEPEQKENNDEQI